GTPGIAAVGKGSASIALRSVRGGGEAARLFGGAMVKAVRGGASRPWGARHGGSALVGREERVSDDRDEVRRQMEVVDRDLEGMLCRGEEVRERVGGLLGRLAAVRQRADF